MNTTSKMIFLVLLFVFTETRTLLTTKVNNYESSIGDYNYDYLSKESSKKCPSDNYLFYEVTVPKYGIRDNYFYDTFYSHYSLETNLCGLNKENFFGQVYSFKLDTEMYYDIKVDNSYSSISENITLALTGMQCLDELMCSVSDGNYNHLSGFLTPGEYKLIAISQKENAYSWFTLIINFSPKLLDGTADNFCLYDNPYPIHIPKMGIKGIYYNYLMQNSIKAKFSCSENNSTVTFYPFTVPNGTVMYFDIKMIGSDGVNKMDTLLAITDANCEEIQSNELISCNDDDPTVGGLSARINGTLYPGDYKIIASTFDYHTEGSFYLEYEFKPISIEPDGLTGSCFNPIILTLIPFNNNINEELTGTFDEYLDETIWSNCSSSSNNYQVYQINIDQGSRIEGVIELFGTDGKNKLDTFIQISDTFCNHLEYCNDDSSEIGGLSSRLEFSLPSGEYKIIVGKHGRFYLNNSYVMKLNARLI